MKVSVEERVYKKAAAHVLRYTTEDVIGVLVGRRGPGTVTLVDAYPLAHGPVMAPLLEIAFELIDANKPEGTTIVGLYEAVVKTNRSPTLTPSGVKVLEVIADRAGADAIALLIDQNTANDEEVITFHARQLSQKEHRLSEVPESGLSPAFAMSSLEKVIRERQYRSIVDFDAHFEDVSLDFRNPTLS
eukprot:TRINITY_DN0_c2073_g1_i2.p1 TRINITY_DN0_c2073_g1~~TRINITY_DN0_c2073_g1_i2.p1  ORF type:complete len:188 (+),score=47.58 TRINITY_DN0_c2073_g1_i2:50-613(+)